MTTTDGRAAIKARHRAAIVQASRALLDRRGAGLPSVEEIADEAGVSRRTVFNHFATTGALQVAVCEDMIEHVVRRLIAPLGSSVSRQDTPVETFATVAAAVRDADLPQVIVLIISVFGDTEPRQQEARDLSQAVFDRVGERMLHELPLHRGQAPSLAARLLVVALTHGMVVIARQWVEETGAELSAASRRRWQVLLEQLLRQVGQGYAASAETETEPQPESQPVTQPVARLTPSVTDPETPDHPRRAGATTNGGRADHG